MTADFDANSRGNEDLLTNERKPGEIEKDIILVVEDSPIASMQIKASLEDSFVVITASDGKEGLLRARDIIPDLIVSDVMMPKLNGFELLRMLKNDLITSHIPIILLTGKVLSEDSIVQGLTIGADDYITKPFSLSLLAARVKNLIDLRRQLQSERRNRTEFDSKQLDITAMDEAFYNKMVYIIEAHLPDPEFNVDALCRSLKMSQSSLYRKVRSITGYSPVHFIRSYRLKRAAQLLEAGMYTVSEAAARIGFPNVGYFTRLFKEQFHGYPSDFAASGHFADDVPTIAKNNDHNSNCESEPCEPEDNKGPDTILLIEDNDVIRMNLSKTLSSLYRVETAKTGIEGFVKAVAIIPDMVICDTATPGNEQLEVCKKLKENVNTSHIPIMLLTVKASEKLIIKGLEIGVGDYLIKPFNSKVLHARIKNMIEQRRMIQIMRHREMELMPSKINESPVERDFIEDLHRVMDQNHGNPNFAVEHLTEKLYMSSASLYRKIKALSGQSPTDYLRNFRLNRAAKLLLSGNESVTEVAFEVGFKNLPYFSRAFKEKFHQMPSSYARSKTLINS